MREGRRGARAAPSAPKRLDCARFCFMRRLAAWVAMAVMWLSSLSPSLAAFVDSPIHPCCLRTGAHHCQGASGEAGLHRAPTPCPYSLPLSVQAFSGLAAPGVQTAAAQRARLLWLESPSRAYGLRACQSTPRAPPFPA